MLEILDVHLKTAASPEIYNAISQAFDMFEAYGLTEYNVGYEDILMSADNEGASESIQRIMALTSQLQDYILQQLRVDLVDEATVSEGNQILLGLRRLEQTEYADNILEICQHVMSPEEALAEILALVNGTDEERVIILLETVDPATIAAIRVMMEKLINDQAALKQPEEDKAFAETLKLYRAALDNQWLYIWDLVEMGEPLGQPYAQYHTEIINQMEERQKTAPVLAKAFAIEIAAQLMAGALISSDAGTGNLRDIVMGELQKTYGDSLDRITPIYNEINSLTIKFQAYREAGTKADKVVLPSAIDGPVRAGPGGGRL